MVLKVHRADLVEVPGRHARSDELGRYPIDLAIQRPALEGEGEKGEEQERAYGKEGLFHREKSSFLRHFSSPGGSQASGWRTSLSPRRLDGFR